MILAVLFTTISFSFAQTKPVQYSQVSKTMSLLNPAYSVTKGKMGFLAQYRQQWMGVENAPQTEAFNCYLNNPQLGGLGFGISIVNYQYLYYSNIDAFLSLAYKIKLDNRNSVLAFGIQGGLNSYDIILDKIHTNSGYVAPDFIADRRFMFMNVGFGAYLKTRKFHLGVSVPEVFSRDYDTTAINQNFDFEKLNSYLYGGFALELDSKVTFKPSIMLKYSASQPYQINLSSHFIFGDAFSIGVGWRQNDAMIFMFDFRIGNFILGYSYDYTLSELSSISDGSHEFTFMFSVPKAHIVDIPSPRFF